MQVRYVNLILGDQLFEDLSALPEGKILMVEDRSLATRSRYHAQKLVLTFSAMRHFAAAHADRVVYFRLDHNRTVFDALDETCRLNVAHELHTYEPADRFFADALRDHCARRNLKLVEHENPMFLTSRGDWERYGSIYNRRFMAEFYGWQRRRLGVLMEPDGSPVGGRWSFDRDNRLKLPSTVKPPPLSLVEPDEITCHVIEEVRKRFPDHPGEAVDFAYPVTSGEAKDWLELFLEERLDRFGDYEDAIPSRDRTVFHSLLTPSLNMGLLTPRHVLDRTLCRHRERAVPINSLEGFVRQLIGWREFIRGIDRDYGSNAELPRGTFTHSRILADCWYDGSTGLPPLDSTIHRVVSHAWCHHIERLMVVGATMFMCEIEPSQAQRWFMEMFVDAAEWVMRPNVIGMSQFADGGLFATKPYLSGSSYILKMSDFEKGPWCDIWDGLYWRTIGKNAEFFSKNARMGQAVKGFDRLEPGRRDRILAAAEQFIKKVTLPPGQPDSNPLG